MTNTPPPPPEQPVEPRPVSLQPTPGLPAPSSSLPQSTSLAPPPVSERAQSRQFAFDGGAGTYLGTGVLAFLITVLTLGICYPFAFVLRERWRAKHSYIEGRQLIFNGRAWGLFGLWLKWLFLSIITLGVYLFWVGPRIYRWKWENMSWAMQTPSDAPGRRIDND